MSIELKIKSKSLAAEARIIRAEENRLRSRLARLAAQENAKTALRTLLLKALSAIQGHRCGAVRNAARRTFAARAFLRGRPCRAIERKTRKDNALTEQDWKAIACMIRRYGSGETAERMQRFKEWKEAACADSARSGACAV
jgi:hypothetical protein